MRQCFFNNNTVVAKVLATRVRKAKGDGDTDNSVGVTTISGAKNGVLVVLVVD